MKNYIALFFLISLATFQSCIKSKEPDKPKDCCAPPKEFMVVIKYVTKDKKELLYVSKNEPYRYDTRKIEIYKVIFGNPNPTKELLASNQRELKNEVGSSSLYFYLPTEDKRVSQLLIYLHPSQEVDTITYKGGGDYNLPYPKDVFYNKISVEKLQTGGGSYGENANGVINGNVQITVTKPEQ